MITLVETEALDGIVFIDVEVRNVCISLLSHEVMNPVSGEHAEDLHR